ncbi:glycosyltransferase [Kinneretia aquatilis]|uniref:glycosyltransferase n=1 Tax=Kinneretia aquatilis TaxID=2070761 RepID=UPI0014952423|nr:nucleotide disphospho-sugar-binding domain-containing protein [Paucibacter aquatile]WIV96124.1 glycosyl transferase family 1 [Paucibacter aquatile]
MSASKLLFVAEAVSLAHVARPSVLAHCAVAAGYEVIFASNGQFPVCSASPEWQSYALHSIAPALFLQRLADGQPVYNEAELRAYVDADIRMLEALRPAAIVGDYRLSLSVAARKVGIPLMSIANAHWSPFARDQQMQAPEIAPARYLGYAGLDLVFRAVWPWASLHHCAAMNRVRADYGLPAYRSLREYYCDGDLTLYSDTPALVPTADLPASHRYVGPIVWSPQMTPPDWWGVPAGQGRPLAYITLGSTGSVDLLPAIIDACLAEGMSCLVATAGRSDFRSDSPYVFCAPYLPGSEAAACAHVVVCNGGSATVQQALQKGRPVLGICSNLDQVLTMKAMQQAGVGRYFRAGQFSQSRMRQALRDLRDEPALRARALAMVEEFARWDPRVHFPKALAAVLS